MEEFNYIDIYGKANSAKTAGSSTLHIDPVDCFIFLKVEESMISSSWSDATSK